MKPEYEAHDAYIHDTFNRMYKVCENMTHKGFTVAELKQALRSAPNRSAPGPNSITYSMIKFAGDRLLQCICHHFNTIVNKREIPEDRTELKIKSIYKNKGKKCDLKNQRGLFLSQTTTKLFEKMILNRISKDLDNNISDFQNGARPNRSTSDNLFIMRTALGQYIYKRYQQQLSGL